MKKIETDYFGIIIWIMPITLTILVGLAFIRIGIDSSASQTNFVPVVVGLLIIAFEIWELIILFDFLKTDFRKIIILDEHLIKIKQEKKETTYQISDLKELELVDRIYGRGLWTKRLTYSKLKFPSSEQIIITSFILRIDEIKEIFKRTKAKVTKRERQLFELIN